MYVQLQENYSKPSCVAKVRREGSATHSVSDEMSERGGDKSFGWSGNIPWGLILKRMIMLFNYENITNAGRN